MEFDEKELRREISYAIKNIHGVRQEKKLIIHHNSHTNQETEIKTQKRVRRQNYEDLKVIKKHGSAAEQLIASKIKVFVYIINACTVYSLCMCI